MAVLIMLPSCDLSQASVDKTNQLFGIWELNKRKTNNGTGDNIFGGNAKKVLSLQTN
jgi:hypothetical protein